MRTRMHHLILAALGGNFVPSRPGLASAGNDYQTGWENEAGGDYATVGDDQESGAAQQLRAPLALRPMNRPAPQYRPGPAPRPQPAPYRPPVQQGPSPEQVRAIAREEINRAISSRVPYGDIPPRPNADEAMFPMGLGFVTLTSVTPIGFLEARPQRAFRGERLVLSISRSAGAASALALLSEFLVGDYKQLVGGGSLPADVFASDAFGVRLMLDGSTPGVLYHLDFQGLAIPPGESIVIAGAVIGRAGEASQR